ncbi:MAG: OmpA family protein, partial [Hyphomicrobiales bacterium]|nr:OmpA family protein [Hyphomicrobiales bacterium]
MRPHPGSQTHLNGACVRRRIDIFITMIRVCFAVAIVAAATGAGRAYAQDFLEQEWVLDPRLSNVYMQTVKKNAIFETHQFTSVEGSVSKNGEAKVKIDLASLDTGVDIRDVRMRFLLFETYKFPHAVISANLDKTRLKALSTKTRMVYPLKFTLGMHGIVNEIQAPVWVTRISDTTLSVATVKPVIVTAESFGLTKNIAKLMETIGGTSIASAASITFDLVFGAGALTSELVAARDVRQKRKAVQAASTITAKECETRFTVISKTGAIYFKTGSAELDQESAPLLNSVADIAKRCPSVSIDVTGHTDSVGTKSFNQQLSERRARSVVDYLTGQGVDAGR